MNALLRIRPINELKNTKRISKLVEESNEPIFITKNGYGLVVIMRIEVYEREIAKNQAINLINESLINRDNHESKIDRPSFFHEMNRNRGSVGILFFPKAKEDLKNIFSYISKVLVNPKAVLKSLSKF